MITLCDKIKEANIHENPTMEALKVALLEHRQELSWYILRTLKSRNESLREHYFWPLLAYEHSNDDAAGELLIKFIFQMEKMKCDIK